MATLTLKNVPEEIVLLLKAAAEKEHRSINREAIYRLERSLEEGQRDDEALMRRIRALREEFPDRLTERRRRNAVREGRE